MKLTFKEVNKDNGRGEYSLACRAIMKNNLMIATSIDEFCRGFETNVKYYPQRNHLKLSDIYHVDRDENNGSAMIIKTSNSKKAGDLYYIYPEGD